MIDPLSHLVVILLAWAICAVVLRGRGALVVLTALGMAFVAIHSPLAAGWIFLTFFEALVLFTVLRNARRSGNWRKYGMYLILPNLLVVDVHPFVLGFNIETLAISFSTIRIFMTGKQLLASRKAEPLHSASWILVGAFWLPAIVIGPVFSALELRKQAEKREILQIGLRDYRLILQGLVLAILANPFVGLAVEKLAGEGGLGWPREVVAPLLFLQLFFAFWGQSLIAEHSSRFFGYALPQNFDAPWKASDIRDFWQRWHRSMAQFVMQYIFLPLQLRGISPKIATVAAFLFMGIWHNLSVGYAIWGIGHGLLLAYWPPIAVGRAAKIISRVLTWLLVISLSYIANFSVLA